MKKFILPISIIISIVIIIGLLYGYPSNREGDIEEENVDWCIPGTVTILDQEMGQEIPIEGGPIFEIKGNATYEGRDVCQAEYTNEEGSLVQYFTKDRDYTKFIYKNSSGDIINEFEMNETGIEISHDEIVYNDSNYEVSIRKTTGKIGES